MCCPPLSRAVVPCHMLWSWPLCWSFVVISVWPGGGLRKWCAGGLSKHPQCHSCCRVLSCGLYSFSLVFRPWQNAQGPHSTAEWTDGSRGRQRFGRSTHSPRRGRGRCSGACPERLPCCPLLGGACSWPCCVPAPPLGPPISPRVVSACHSELVPRH